MTRSVKTCLSIIVMSTCVSFGAFAANKSVAPPAGLKTSYVAPVQAPQPVSRPFKLKGGGQIDLSTFAFDFGGQATHLGLFTATGQLDPQTFQIQGTITAADGDTLNFVAQFNLGPLGEIEAAFQITGGTGRFDGATGSASGPVNLDPDFMFTLNLEGTINY